MTKERDLTLDEVVQEIRSESDMIGSINIDTIANHNKTNIRLSAAGIAVVAQRLETALLMWKASYSIRRKGE
jgi:hypothetical protein